MASAKPITANSLAGADFPVNVVSATGRGIGRLTLSTIEVFRSSFFLFSQFISKSPCLRALAASGSVVVVVPAGRGEESCPEIRSGCLDLSSSAIFLSWFYLRNARFSPSSSNAQRKGVFLHHPGNFFHRPPGRRSSTNWLDEIGW